ncbi:hypothetical protein BKI52_39935 [marine bacterium AO1-C]|nr:hypothetical protein BKI52_39935 [marine bacterium AO1-C]
MKDFKFPKSITIELPKLEKEWLQKNPLLISVKTFAKNKIADNKLWGGYDHHLDMLLLRDVKTVFTGEFLKRYDSLCRDLSSMEIRPIEFHYSLVEIELMNKESLQHWMKYLKQSKHHFAYEDILGTVIQLKEQINNSGNNSIRYQNEFHRIRDLWDSDTDEKEYKFEFERKK